MTSLDIWTEETYPLILKIRNRHISPSLERVFENAVRKIESKIGIGEDFTEDLEILSLTLNNPTFMNDLKKSVDSEDFEDVMELSRIVNRLEKIAYSELPDEDEIEEEVEEKEKLPNMPFSLDDLHQTKEKERLI